MKKVFAIITVLVLILSMLVSCGETDSTSSTNNGLNSSSSKVEVDFAKDPSEMFTERDLEAGYNESNSVKIQLNGDSATSSSNSVKIQGKIISITEEATYVISGTLNDGQIVVNAKDDAKPQLVLNGVNITSKTCAPICILESNKVFITLASGTQNTLTNGGTLNAIDDNAIDAALYSKQDLTINGSGSLTVTSPAGHGITSKDNLVIAGGTYIINCASHGIDANDSLRIADAKITIDAGKDGIHAENTSDTTLGFIYISNGKFNIEAEGDGISAGIYLQIEDGTIDIVSGGGSANSNKQTSDSWGGFMGGGRPGMPGGQHSSSSTTTTEDSTSIKGIKSGADMLIAGGKVTIDSADDAVHSNASIVVNGGNFEIASGDDAFHADESLTIAAGTINITESYEGLEALNIEVKGGNIKLVASDDGLNAAGGNDSSGFGGDRGNDKFGGFGGPGGMGGGMSSSSNGSVVISGGTLYVRSSGDGIDANGTLTISGGNTTICGPTQGDTATLDYDSSATISGGTFIGTGALGMAQTFSDTKQGVIALSVGNQSAGTEVIIKDNSGKTLLSYKPELAFAVVIFSSPDIKSGEEYTVSIGGNSKEFTAS